MCFVLLNLLTYVILQIIATIFYACDKDLNSPNNRIEHDSYPAIEWFEDNPMKLNQDKCHFLVSRFKYENLLAQIRKANI